MIKIFTSNKIIQKIAIILAIIISFEFIATKPVEASIGGILSKPVSELFISIGDGVMGVMQEYIFHLDKSFIDIDRTGNKISTAIGIGIAVIFVVASVVLAVATAGSSLALEGAALKAGMAAAGVVAAITSASGATIAFFVTKTVSSAMMDDDVRIPVFIITPEEIFTNKIPLLDVNFFNPSTAKKFQSNGSSSDLVKADEDDEDAIKSITSQLQSTIAKWYIALRNLVLVALLSVLVWIGIKIVLSTVAGEKAKYKQMLLDWLVGVCLIFFMHYIMSFAVTMNEKIVGLIGASLDNQGVGIVKMSDSKVYNHKIKDADGNDVKLGDSLGDSFKDKSTDTIYWPANNFAEYARLEAQWLDEDSNFDTKSFGWMIIYVMLVIYTVIFLWTYLRRVAYMALLTLIAPLVALSYPIDKMNDGKAQGFDMWLKEYIFNLLIQPMHLILYYILVGSAMSIAAKNPVYVIVILGFMVPAEKLLRKMFGFEKASTPGLLAGPAGGALMMEGMKRLFGHAPKEGKDGGGNSSAEESDFAKPMSSNFDKMNALFSGDEPGASEGADDNIRQQNLPGGDGNYGNTEDDGDTEDTQNINGGGSDSDYGADEELPDANDEQEIGQNLGSGSGNNSQGNNSYDESEHDFSNSQGSNNNERKPKRAIRKGIGAYARQWRQIKGAQVYNRAKRFRPKIAKQLSGIALGGLAGMAGLMIGAATGDASKAFQYATGGALAGNKYARGNVDKIYSSYEDKERMKDAYKKASYATKEDAEKAMHKEYKKEYKNKPKNREKLDRYYNYDKNEIKDISENNSVMDQCMDNGIKNIDDMIAVNEYAYNDVANDIRNSESFQSAYGSRTEDEQKAIAMEQARASNTKNEDERKRRQQARNEKIAHASAIAKYSGQVGDVLHMHGEDQDKWIDTLSRQFMESDVLKNKYNEQNVARIQQQIMQSENFEENNKERQEKIMKSKKFQQENKNKSDKEKKRIAYQQIAYEQAKRKNDQAYRDDAHKRADSTFKEIVKYQKIKSDI